MNTTVLAHRIKDPSYRKMFARIHSMYRPMTEADFDCPYLLCSHSLTVMNPAEVLKEIQRTLGLAKTGEGQRLEYQEFDGVPMRCFWNVQKAIGHEGGQMQTGWLVSAFNGWMGIDLCWHAAWQRPDGKVVEVSPGYQRCFFVASQFFRPTAFVARTFPSTEEMGRFLSSGYAQEFGTEGYRDDGFVLESGHRLDLGVMVKRARLLALQQAKPLKKRKFKRRPKRQ